MDHFQMYVQRYANYIFNWIIPYVSVRVNSDNVFNCNPRTWIDNMRRRSNHPDQHQTGSNRSGLPLWSSKYVFDLIVNGRLTLGDRQMCKGHNLQVAVLCHKLFPFYDAVVPAANNLPHYVDEDEDVTTMFDDAYTMKFRTEPGI